MERTIAIKKLAKMLGKGFGYRVDREAPTPEERQEATAELPAAIAARDEVKQQRDARYKAILAADQEYQALIALYKVAQKQVEKLSYTTRRRKFTVGVSNGMFFHVKADGDSWEDVIGKLTSK